MGGQTAFLPQTYLGAAECFGKLILFFFYKKKEKKKSDSMELGILTFFFFWTPEWLRGMARFWIGRLDRKEDDVLVSIGWDTTRAHTHQPQKKRKGRG
jgi:hypothetical protein